MVVFPNRRFPKRRFPNRRIIPLSSLFAEELRTYVPNLLEQYGAAFRTQSLSAYSHLLVQNRPTIQCWLKKSSARVSTCRRRPARGSQDGTRVCTYPIG